tara:strand:- start:2484 stop:2825 length:342 start_codon:yes stop_codon:yes gene_type:complete
MRTNKIEKTRKVVLQKLNKILLLLLEEGMSDKNTNEEYKQFLGNIGLVLSTLCLAISMEDESEMVEVLDKFNVDSIVKSLNISTEGIHDEDFMEQAVKTLGISESLNGKHNLN